MFDFKKRFLLIFSSVFINLFAVLSNAHSSSGIINNWFTDKDNIKTYYGKYVVDSYSKYCLGAPNVKCYKDETKPDEYVKDKRSIIISKDKYVNYIKSSEKDGYVIEHPIYVRELKADNMYADGNMVFYVYGQIKGYRYHKNLTPEQVKDQVHAQMSIKAYLAKIVLDNSGNILEQRGIYNFLMKKQ